MPVIKLAKNLKNENRLWGENPIKSAELTDKQYTELCERVLSSGKKRHNTQGGINEGDFVAGALTVFDCLNIRCPTFILSIIHGEKLFS